MRRFVTLYERMDGTTSTDAKVEAMREYFADVPAADGAWAIHILAGEKLSRIVKAGHLRRWAREAAEIESWLFEESYGIVGDLAETVSLLVDASPARVRADEDGLDVTLSDWIEARLLPMRGLDPNAQREIVLRWWATLDRAGIYLLTKLMTGAMRVGVSKTLVVRALADFTGAETSRIARRLMGRWDPTAQFFERLVDTDDADDERWRPYPFFLASPIGPEDGATPVEDWLAANLGEPRGWQAEWKWDGIRAQLIRREGEVFLWSRGGESVTEAFPEIVDAGARLVDGIVLDGEVLAWRDGAPRPFPLLQRRLGRKSLGARLLRDAPAAFVAYDALESEGLDIRDQPLERRRQALNHALGRAPSVLMPSPVLQAATWRQLADLRAGTRERGVEGLMLKRIGSPYRSGRRRGDWWKWKVDPLTIDAVLTYAQPGHGRRANLLTDYTFGVWSGDDTNRELITVAKAYSGLSDEEIQRLDRWIRSHTTDRFGPVRAVEPQQVFEIAFDSVRASDRHKSGVALRFPRIARWRGDKPPGEADTLDHVKRLLRDSNPNPHTHAPGEHD